VTAAKIMAPMAKKAEPKQANAKYSMPPLWHKSQTTDSVDEQRDGGEGEQRG
jgi:hypothetical protein